MKKSYLLLLSICSILIFSSCGDDDEVIVIEDTPVSVKRFRVNFVDIDYNGGTTTHGINDHFRISFDFIDEGELGNFEFYMLINDDPDKRYILTRPRELYTTEMSFGYTFDRLSRFKLENDEYYDTVVGDELHFYATVTDDTNNLTSINIVVTLTE